MSLGVFDAPERFQALMIVYASDFCDPCQPRGIALTQGGAAGESVVIQLASRRCAPAFMGGNKQSGAGVIGLGVGVVSNRAWLSPAQEFCHDDFPQDNDCGACRHDLNHHAVNFKPSFGMAPLW
jgi:hypothetical protein